MSAAGLWSATSPKRLFCDGPSPVGSPCASRAPFHVLTSVDTASGLYFEAKDVAARCTYLPALPLIAGLPVPNTSYAAPNRGDQFDHFGRSAMPAKVRAGTNRPAGELCSGIDSFR